MTTILYYHTILLISLTIAALLRAANTNLTRSDLPTNLTIINYDWQGDHGWSCNKASANAKHMEVVPLIGDCGTTNRNDFKGKKHAWLKGENECTTRVTQNGLRMDPFVRDAAIVVCAGADVDGQDDRTIVVEWWPHHDCDSYGEGGGPDGPYTVELVTNSGVCIDPHSTEDHNGGQNKNVYSFRWHYK